MCACGMLVTETVIFLCSGRAMMECVDLYTRDAGFYYMGHSPVTVSVSAALMSDMASSVVAINSKVACRASLIAL